MKNRLLFLFFLSVVILKAQMPGGPPGGGGNNKAMMSAMKDIKGRVYGKLIDAQTKKPIEFASVTVLWYNKDSLVGGALANGNGEFNVDGLPPMGGFRFRATQIGYKTYETKIYIQIPNKLEQDLGNIALQLDEKQLGEVEVTAEKNTVVMSIDKRTYNVDKDISVRGGTAADVMKNVPGVTVDADGNAQLRNLAPTIYVDGRPTTLTLQQIPADQIDRIEIITNPSVKYDASATGGILNIILKKNLKPGYNGMAMAYVGTGDRYGGMVNLNVKEGKWNFTGMYSYNQAINIPLGYTHRTNLDSATGTVQNYYNQNNKTNQKNMFNFGKIGIDYSINNRNTISLNSTIVGGQFNTADRVTYAFEDAAKTPTASGLQVNNQTAAFQNYNGQLLYKKTFPKAGRELTADMNYNYTNSNNGYLFSNFITDPVSATIYQKNSGNSVSNQFVFQTDYTNPISETKKFEAGIKVYYKNTLTTNNAAFALGSQDDYVKDIYTSNRYIIHDMTNAAYVNYSDKTFWGINYQAGLRFENSVYQGNITDKDIKFSYNYPGSARDLMKSIFPGIYFSKKFKKGQEWQLNFSRKINRPNFFQLMPVKMFSDPQNFRIGNPQLRPEFKNIAEINYNKTFTKGSYLASGYFRYEEQPITDVAYPLPDTNSTVPASTPLNAHNSTILVNTTVNGKNSIRYGMEHTVKYTFLKNLDVTLNLNAFYVFIRGQVDPSNPLVIESKGYAFNAKANVSYRFPKQITLQVNGNYESPKILLLGTTLPLYSMDVSLNKTIGAKWVLNATLSDVFNTRRMGTDYTTPYYTQVLSRRRETRYVRVAVTYMFGKMDASIFKRAKQMKNDNQQQGNQDGLDFGK
jgi:iron complex outermembrane receptor protein